MVHATGAVNAEGTEGVGEIEKHHSSHMIEPFLENINRSDVTTEVRSLFQYFTTLNKKADLLLRHWRLSWSTGLLGRREWKEEKTSDPRLVGLVIS